MWRVSMPRKWRSKNVAAKLGHVHGAGAAMLWLLIEDDCGALVQNARRWDVRRQTRFAKGRNRLDELARFLEVADGGAEGLPPVHLWNPEHCGDIGMEIRRDGSWWYAGSRIGRERLVKLFARILRKDDDGVHYLVTPVEKVVVHVEIAPFLAVRMDVIDDGDTPRLRFTTNLGDVVDAGLERPIRVETDPETLEPTPFVNVRAGLEALMTRSVFFDLAEVAEEVSTPDGLQLVVRSCGASFPIGPVVANSSGVPAS